ncbi:MAG: FAD-dependent oxidoreductase [Methanotrichaceae archaeon]|nr:FAD-dependent oxidoreductase [Methanotrichaceae archaeon]
MKFEAEVVELIQRTPHMKSIRFTRSNDFSYLPGQFIFITLKDEESEMTKHFSISSSPTEDFLEITKRLTGHPFSNALNALAEGDTVLLNGPFGKFTLAGEHKKVGMISGGVGIAPLRSMIKYSFDKGLDTDIILLNSNRSEEDIAFNEEFKTMQRQNANIKIVNTATRPEPSWTGLRGRIDAELIQKYIPDYNERIIYTCGPRKMVDSMLALLKELKVPTSQIRTEYFPGYD